MERNLTKLIIRSAERTEFQDVRLFYHSLIDSMNGSPYHPKWQKDIYPAQEDLKTAIDEQTLFIGLDGDRIAGAMVVNHKFNEEYDDATWSQKLRPDEFMVIHMLGVHRDLHGKGYAKELVRYALNTARDAGMKDVRLDVLKGNLPAERLYEGLGFHYVETLEMFYEDTGRVDFELYEYEIEAES